MSKVKIITDSGSDISWERAKELGIRMLPISFSFDGETYCRQGIDMSIDEYYTKLKQSSVIPKTAQVTPIEYTDAFNEEYDNGYDTLIVVTLSSKGSGMYQNAVLSAREVMEERGGEIIVVDSHGFSCMYGPAVIHSAHMLQNGKSKEEIVAYLEDVFSTMQTYFLVGDLEHLKKGGRINTATLVVANMLDIKPVLTISGGVVVQKDKIRGSKRILKKLIYNAVDDGYDFEGKTVILVDTAQPEKREDLKNEFEKNFENINLVKCAVGSVIGCHGGPDLVGFIFSYKYDLSDYEE